MTPTDALEVACSFSGDFLHTQASAIHKWQACPLPVVSFWGFLLEIIMSIHGFLWSVMANTALEEFYKF